MDLSPHLPALQVIVPMLCSPLMLLLKPRGLAWAAATMVSLFTFAIALAMAFDVYDGVTYTYDMGGWKSPYGIELSVDAFSISSLTQ